MGSLEDVEQRVTIEFTFLKDHSHYYEDSVLERCQSRTGKPVGSCCSPLDSEYDGDLNKGGNIRRWKEIDSSYVLEVESTESMLPLFFCTKSYFLFLFDVYFIASDKAILIIDQNLESHILKGRRYKFLVNLK